MRRGVLLPATVLFLAVAGLLGYLGLRSKPVRVAANVFVNPPGLIDAFSTPAVSRDPLHPSWLAAVYRQDRPRFSSQVAWSSNGGRSWRTTNLPLPPGTHEAFFPDAAFAPDGSLYAVYVDLAGSGNVPAHVFMAKSTDGGRSFSDPVQVAGADAFQPRIVVGPGGTLYVTWMQVTREQGARLNNAPTRVMVTTSTDGGATFGPPLQVSPAGQRVSAPVGAVTSSGDLVVAYEDLGSQTAAAPTPSESYRLMTARMSGGSGSIAAPVVVAPGVVGHQVSSLFDPLFPSLAAGSKGELYLAWSNRVTGGEEVLLSRSADAGATWSGTTRVDDGPSGPIDYLPGVAVAPDGRVDVVYLAEHTDKFADTIVAISRDQGRSFERVQLSSASFDITIGPTFGASLPADLGSHLGVASADGSLVALWTDSRLGTTATGRQDIVSAVVTVPGRGASRYLELGGAALALVLATASLVAATRRRPSPAATRRRPSPAG